MKKSLILITMLVCFVGSAYALPFVPAFLYFGLPAAAVDLSLITHATVGAALWWYNRPGSAKNVTSSGDLISPGKVQWVDLQNSKLGTFEADTNNKIAYDDLKDKVLADKTRYPQLASAIERVIVPQITIDSAVGSVVSVPGYSNKQITNKTVWTSIPPGGQCSSPSSAILYEETRTVFYTNYTKNWNNNYCYFGSTTLNYSPASTLPPPTVATGSEFSDFVKNPDNTVKDEYKGEIDDFITSNPNVIHYEDDSGNDIKSQIPTTALSQSDANIQLAKENASAAAAQASAAATSASTSAASAATAARNSYVASGGDPATGTGGDAGLYQKYLEAQAAADAAAAEAARLAAQQANDAVGEEESENFNAPGVPDGELNSLDFSPLVGLGSTMQNKWPFTLVSSITETIGLFVSEPSAPAFNVHILGEDYNLSLAVFDPIAAVCRYTLALLLSIGGGWFVIRKFSS